MRYAMLGSPDRIDVRYDDAQLTGLRRLGFDAVEIHVSWGYRGG